MRACGRREFGVRRASECGVYIPTLCALSTPRMQKSVCSDCKFDFRSRFVCPVVAAGYYAYRTGQSEVSGGCRSGKAFDSFMSQSSSPPPSCGSRCCRTDHKGEFKKQEFREESATVEDAFSSSLLTVLEDEKSPPKFTFQPTDSSCKFNDINRGQVMQLLSAHSTPLVVMGDSTMRQLYLRLIAMMRGESRLVDYHIHTHAQYKVCRQVDYLRLSANSAEKKISPSDSWFLRSIIPAFFNLEVGPGREDAKRVLSECSHAPLEMNYIQAPLSMAQAEMLTKYIKSQKTPKRKPLVVLSVGFWQSGEEIPEAYLQTLTQLQDRVSRFVYVGMPVSVVHNHTQRLQFKRRNELMREWINEKGPQFLYVDFDALASSSNAPNGTKGSKHYSCWIEWSKAMYPFGASENPSGTSQIFGEVARIHTDIDGECSDEMNRNLWQVIFNGLFDSFNAE